MAERSAEVTPDKRLEFGVGIQFGDVVRESDDDLMGDDLNIAARLGGRCRGVVSAASGHGFRLYRQEGKS